MPFPNFLNRYIPQGHCNAEMPMDWQSFLTRITIRTLKKMYGRSIFGVSKLGSGWARAQGMLDMDASIDYIRSALLSGRPFMTGKIGTGDMETLQRFIDIHSPRSRLSKWIDLFLGKGGPFWYDNWIRSGICVCAGVFPSTDESIEEFCRIFMEYCADFDAIPSWLEGEARVYNQLCPDAKIIKLESLAPFRHPRSWYDALEGKNVLVVHPYINTIKSQYAKHVEFHKGQGCLPEFNLIQYCPVNSIGGKCERFGKWKDALDFMISDIEKIQFDVALLGCGVYGVPLSVHIKRMGRQAVYTGGATQIIFGIKGRRWDKQGIYNEHWVRPSPEDVPSNMNMIEAGTFL